ncbi:sodium- and chloride-dependent glycine transporter 1-like [Ylistrum balloti]|uniref:sodium- and chloride-dependent glycine transporter 1-like n=1 Tax=Ylistrum balloti TaxID=509963 RepID=UPI00290580D0|nr:sodium- and chloride-dependent glycine transporter 1-like [Ylistrum balloti]
MKRGNWGGKLEFILTCVGYAVGLGNVWRFPYLAYKNGGGAFLIPYWFMQIFVGMPLFYMELCFGQFASLGPLAIWKINPLFKGLGYCSVISSALIGLYYNVIIAYCIYYFFASMTDLLPWALETDIAAGSNSTNVTVNLGLNTTNSTTTVEKSESEKYFYETVLNISTGLEDMGGVQWQLALCLLAAWVIVLIVLSKGIQSLGKVVYFTATFPYLLLTALLIRGATLPGASEGIQYYLTPTWDRLQDSTVWSDAATQVFYSLSACSGGLILMSSFNRFDNFCLRDALIVPCVDCLTSFFSGFVIFTVLGFMANAKGVKVEDVATGGSGLAFVVYPEAISNMPAPTVWAVLFFFMLLVIGFSSQFSIMECVMSSFIDEYAHILRKNWKNSFLFRVGVAALFYLLALPMTTRGGLYLLELVDSAVSGFPLLFVGLFECIVINWIYGYSNFAKDIQMMMKRTPWAYWVYCWCGKTPLVLSVVIVFKAVQYEKITLLEYVYPAWGEMLWWMVTLFPIMAIPGWFLFYYCRHGGWQVLAKLTKPLPEWGPAEDINRDGIRYKKKSAIQMEISNPTPTTFIRYDDKGKDNEAFTAEENLSSLGYQFPPDYDEATHM